MHGGLTSLFLCGDVMLGRGIDQILPHPGDPELREPLVRDARTYIGRDTAAARRPVAVRLDDRHRVVVLSAGYRSSGIPAHWAATATRSGVDLEPTAADIVHRVRQVKQPGDVVVASIHWGSNWGYHLDRDEIRFAHDLIDGGVDVVHGHSSHHPRPIEIYRGRLILYGCGDLINDYEGISGHEPYRDDLRLLYLASLSADDGRLIALRMTPLQAHRMSLRHARAGDSRWLATTLRDASRDFDLPVRLDPDGTLTVEPPADSTPHRARHRAGPATPR